MYCSSCGSAINPNLVYCNRCGARANGRSEVPAKVADFPESLVAAMVGLFVLGIGVVIGLLAVMKNVVNFEPNIILAITLLIISLLVSLEAVFIYLLFSARRALRQRLFPEDVTPSTTKELSEQKVPMLSEPRPSVTEQTTRAFEPVYREQTGK